MTAVDARFRVAPVDASFGAVVTGVRLTSLSKEDHAELYRLWLDRALLIFPDQHLDDAQQIAFARRFGDLEIEMVRIGNLDDAGRVRDPDDDYMRMMDGNRFWHADSTFKPVQAKGAVFSARVVPKSGGETAWADMAAAYEALDAATRAKVDALFAYHSLRHSQTRVGRAPRQDDAYASGALNIDTPPLRPLVTVHAETGRRCLNIGRHASHVTGMGDDESEAFLASLIDFACRPPRVWTHRWRAGDVVVWDNRRLLHRVEPFDIREPRDMRHTRLAGDPVADFAPGHRVDWL